MPEQRNDMRRWIDTAHKVFAGLTMAGVLWVMVTSHYNDKATAILLSKFDSYQKNLIALQAKQEKVEHRINQLESYLPRIDERTKFIQSSADKIIDRVDHLTKNQHEFMPIVYEAQRFMREQSK